jgi:hypothetical protein
MLLSENKSSNAYANALSYDRLCYELTPFSNLLLQTTTCNSVKALKWTEFVTITVVSVRVSVMSHIKKK